MATTPAGAANGSGARSAKSCAGGPSPALPRILIGAALVGVVALSDVDASVYHALPGSEPGTVAIENPRHGLQAQLGPNVLQVQPLAAGDAPWSLGLRTLRFGSPGALRPVSRGALHVDGARVEIDRGDLVEWYVNGDTGLKHGYTLRRAAAGSGTTLHIEIGLDGGLKSSFDGAGRWVDFYPAGSRFAVLRYAGLIVRDAADRILPARIETAREKPADGAAVRIVIDARDAAWPIDVDPVLTGASWTSSLEDSTVGLAWGDWDADGDLDLAVANLDQPNRVYRNDGAFLTEAWASGENDATAAVAWGDLDADGDLDLAVANLDQPSRIYRNEGGTLSLLGSFEAEQATTSLAWGDWDGDGVPDLAVGNRGGPNRVYGFASGEAVPVWSSEESDPTTAVVWGDWNRDGRLDLIVGNDGQPNRIYLGAETGLGLRWSSAEADATTSIAVGDLDGDRDLDLAVGNDGQPNRIYRNAPDTTPTLVWSSPETGRTRSIALGDVEGDGDLDLAVANAGDPDRLYANVSGEFKLDWSSDRADPSTGLAWGDWDGDGNLELAVAHRGRPVRVHANMPGNFPASWEAPTPELTMTVAWGDYDDDGDLDLMVGNDDEPFNGFVGGLKLLRNAGGAFSPIWLSSRKDSTRSVAWGDFDGDGDLDLMAGNWSQPNILYRNHIGTLQPFWFSDEEDPTWQVAWGDWDGDGDLDLAVANWQRPNRIYENTGTALRLAWSFDDDGRSNSVAWGDWDGDRDPDLAVGNNSGPTRVYENLGGRLELAWESDELDQTTGVAWGDWDGDGDLDLGVGNHSEPNRIYENLGDRRMVPVWASVEQETTENVAWGDWDGDGDLDLAAGNEWEFVRLYENDAGTMKLFQSAGEWDALLRSVEFADFDGDGDLDLAAANRCPVVVNRVYENRRLSRSGLPDTPVHPVSTRRPGSTPAAYYRSSAERLTEPIIQVPYVLVDEQGDPAVRVEASYSPNGGGAWFPATPGPGGSGSEFLAASRQGIEHSFAWDAAADAVCSDNVVVRFTVRSQVPALVGGPIQQASVSSVTPPFRVGGPSTIWYRDGDGDGFGDPGHLLNTCRGEEPRDHVTRAGDCGDANATVFPGAPEVNDGVDNQCPGETGYDSVDEIAGGIEFPQAGGPERACWAPQPGAADYQLVRSRRPDFGAECLQVTTLDTCADDGAPPAVGRVFYYLVRPLTPHRGSFGRDSDGNERVPACLSETKPRGGR